MLRSVKILVWCRNVESLECVNGIGCIMKYLFLWHMEAIFAEKGDSNVVSRWNMHIPLIQRMVQHTWHLLWCFLLILLRFKSDFPWSSSKHICAVKVSIAVKKQCAKKVCSVNYPFITSFYNNGHINFPLNNRRLTVWRLTTHIWVVPHR